MFDKSVHGKVSISFTPLTLPVTITSSRSSQDFFREIWDDELFFLQEQVYVLCINQSNNIICWRCVNTGTLGSSLVDIRLIVSIALGCNANKIIIAHNHTSGILVPSPEDEEVTRKLLDAVKYLNIRVLDHIILTKDSYYSFRDNELIIVS